jgi:hypothetical protein
MKVPFLPKQKIEQDAEDLLAEFSRAAGKPVELTIPIDDIADRRFNPRFRHRRYVRF